MKRSGTDGARQMKATVAVNVNWNSDDRDWNCNANGLDDNAWNVGNRVFSRRLPELSLRFFAGEFLFTFFRWAATIWWMVIDGKKIAVDIIAELKKRPKPDKFLAAILVGENPASISFLNQKKKIADELGVDFRLHKLPEDVPQNDLTGDIKTLAADANCGGIILQLPLPAGLDRNRTVEVIPPEKDVDALRSALQLNEVPSLLPPAVLVVEAVIRNSKFEIQNSSVAVVGLGFLVGRPVANWAKGKFKEVFLLDKGDDLSVLKNADIVVCGTGVPSLIKPDVLKENALVIDFGYGQKDGKPSGDFDANSLINRSTNSLISYTPVPGGTGPILVAKLLENFYKLNAS